MSLSFRRYGLYGFFSLLMEGQKKYPWWFCDSFIRWLMDRVWLSRSTFMDVFLLLNSNYYWVFCPADQAWFQWLYSHPAFSPADHFAADSRVMRSWLMSMGNSATDELIASWLDTFDCTDALQGVGMDQVIVWLGIKEQSIRICVEKYQFHPDDRHRFRLRSLVDNNLLEECITIQCSVPLLKWIAYRMTTFSPCQCLWIALRYGHMEAAEWLVPLVTVMDVQMTAIQNYGILVDSVKATKLLSEYGLLDETITSLYLVPISHAVKEVNQYVMETLQGYLPTNMFLRMLEHVPVTTWADWWYRGHVHICPHEDDINDNNVYSVCACWRSTFEFEFAPSDHKTVRDIRKTLFQQWSMNMRNMLLLQSLKSLLYFWGDIYMESAIKTHFLCAFEIVNVFRHDFRTMVVFNADLQRLCMGIKMLPLFSSTTTTTEKQYFNIWMKKMAPITITKNPDVHA